MPPRRAAARAPRSASTTLPTPTASNDGQSTASSSSPDATMVKAEPGLITPASLVDDASPSASRRTKRKVASPDDEDTPSKRAVIDHVSLPKRVRSKLGTEKTTSAENLTLDGRVKQELKPGINGAADESDDQPPKRRARARVTYAESDSEEEKPLSRARGRRAPAKPKRISLDSAEDDYAMNSEDEASQLRDALLASTQSTPNGGSSSVSPSSSSRSIRAGSSKSGQRTPLRTAVARAARAEELRQRAGRSATDVSFVTSEGGTPPIPGGGSTPSEASFSAEESDESDVFVDSDSPLSDVESDSASQPGPSKKAGKGKKQKSYRLDGGEVDELPAEWKKGRGRKGRKADEGKTDEELEHAKLIRKKEAALKKELGRKLTQGEKNNIRLCMHHPELENVWGDLAANVEPIKPVPMEAHPSLKLTLLPFQKESLYWMKKQEEGPWAGGMLADEMGMGKTIQTIALLLSEPRHKPSLVVAPVVALMQWKNEIETHAEGFTVCLWHGSGRMKASDLKKFDVVLVSYGTLEASFRRQQRGFKRGNLIIKEKSPMHSFEWYRVVLDEAHNIKERSTNAAKAAFALQAKYRWCLSGTPLQNRVGELYSLVRFLGADPFSYYFCKQCPCKSLHWKFANRRDCDECGHSPMQHVSLWNSEILTPIARYGIEEGGPGKTAFKKLKILLDRMMLRRTKLERADDLGLPPRIITVRRDFFSPAEKELYMSLFTGAKRQFNTYLDQGTVLNNYSNIFSLITRMRQMACHPDLVLRSKTSALAQVAAEGTVCRLCNDVAEDAIVSACKHVFDRECIRQYLEVQQLRGHAPECPVCHIEISIDLEQEAIDLEEGGKRARQGILSRLDLATWRSSSKLEALVEELEKQRKQDCTIKSLVFSQFVSFLDLIAFRLQRAGFNICRLEGGMTPQQRDATIQHFMKNPGVTVFLISLKAGGVALNLTEASTVFMMDSWWNPSVEYQAMDRIHRLGQKRPVKVVKLVVEDSIEDQIVQLQAKKLAMTDAALSRDPDAALGKLTVEDLGFLFKL